MNKSRCKEQIKACLREALNQYAASSGMTQEKLAEKLGVTPRACSAIQNGKYSFSAFSVLVLFALLPRPERILLLDKLCSIILSPNEEAA